MTNEQRTQWETIKKHLTEVLDEKKRILQLARAKEVESRRIWKENMRLADKAFDEEQIAYETLKNHYR